MPDEADRLVRAAMVTVAWGTDIAASALPMLRSVDEKLLKAGVLRLSSKPERHKQAAAFEREARAQLRACISVLETLIATDAKPVTTKSEVER